MGHWSNLSTLPLRTSDTPKTTFCMLILPNHLASCTLMCADLPPKIGNPFSKIHPANILPTIDHQKLAAPSSVMRAWLCGLRGAQTISLSRPQIAQQPPPTLSSDYSSPVSSNVLHVEIMHTTGRTSCLFICFKLFISGFKCYSFEWLHNWVHGLQVGTRPQIRFIAQLGVWHWTPVPNKVRLTFKPFGFRPTHTHPPPAKILFPFQIKSQW